MSSFLIYLIGFIVLIAGLAYGAFMLALSLIWIGVCSVSLIGLCIITGVGKTRQKDETPSSE
jgi:membrane-bound acyltransferase YfiQ involved in biofilm formation